MPGYYDWKIRNCTGGAIAKAKSLMATFEEVDPYLIELWSGQGDEFDEKQNAALAAVVEQIDTAEEALEQAKLKLAGFFPGLPAAGKEI